LWDYQDRLRQTVLGGGGTAYHVYDASGQRVRKVWEKAPGLIEERIYIGAFEIFRKHGGAIGANTATLERETLHVTDDKQRVAVVETRTLDIAGNDPAPRQSIRYQLGNHLGSACLELDDQAQIISYEEYSPYGDSTYQAVRSQTETPKRYRYTGKERDEESGFYYYGARYCAPWLGRWVSCDPAGVTHSPNLFAAMDCNPIVLIDPTGCQSELFLTHRGPSLLPSLVPEPVSPSLSPRDRYSAIPNLADSTPQEPPSNLSKFRATVRSMGTQGLPVNLLNTVADKVASGEYSIETASLQGDDRFIPSAKQLNVAPSSLEGWRRIAKGGEVRVADTGALVHESTHAYFHIKNSDPTFAGVIAKGIEHYRDAPLVGGGVANDPERIFQEAVAGYVEHRIISYARTRDQLTDFKHIVDAGELAIPSEELSGMLDKLASDYDKDQADLTFGYENQYGWSGKNQVYTTRDLSPELSNFLDENVLEGSIAHHFSDSKELTALMTSIRERLAAPAAQPGRRAQ
jgi:RHS repeat-associated protein